jgi:hypothetical protein
LEVRAWYGARVKGQSGSRAKGAMVEGFEGQRAITIKITMTIMIITITTTITMTMTITIIGSRAKGQGSRVKGQGSRVKG